MTTNCELTYHIKLRTIRFCKYELKVGEKIIFLSFPQLLQLRLKLNQLTSPLQLSEIIENDNFVLLFLADKTHVLFLEIPQLLDLKDEIFLFFEEFKSVSF